MLVFFSCNNVSNKVFKEREKEEMLQEMTSFRSKLPYTVPGTGITLIKSMLMEILSFTHVP